MKIDYWSQIHPNAQAAKEEVIAYIAKKGYGEVTGFSEVKIRIR